MTVNGSRTALVALDLESHSSADHLRLIDSLHALVAEDATIGVRSDSATLQTVITATGDLQLETLQPSEIVDVYRHILPGARIHHHLEWRYTAVWRRNI